MDSEVEAEQPYVIAAFLRMKNPYYAADGESQVITTEQRNAFIAAGYDGVIDMDEETGIVGEYVVFETDQIAQFHEGVIEIPDAPVIPRKRVRELEDSPSP